MTPDMASLTATGQQTVVEAASDGQIALFGRMIGKAPANVGIAWNALPVETVNALIGFASDGSPLADLFAAIGPDLAKAATHVLVTSIAMGISPRQAARGLDTVLNVGRSRAESIARTEMLRAAREAERQTRIANKHLLVGWYWYSARNNRTCRACWAMHGTLHDVGETLDDHINGCCVAVPCTKSWAEITGDDSIPDNRRSIPSGENEFADLNEVRQKQILGPGLFDLYLTGDIKLSDCVTQVSDDRWGTMRRPATIAEALANAAHRAN